MSTHYYLGWRPVACTPIHNTILLHRVLDGPELERVLQRIPLGPFVEISRLEFAVRLDGLLLFRLDILTDNSIGPPDDWYGRVFSTARGVLGWIKVHTGHANDFHPYSIDFNHPEFFLFIDPIEVFDPYDEESFVSIRDLFVTRPSLPELLMNDRAVSELHCVSRQNGKMSPRHACLVLRQYFARKREMCVETVHRRKQEHPYKMFTYIFVMRGVAISLLLLALIFHVFSVPWTFGNILMYVVASVMFMAAAYSWIDRARRRDPILAMIRHTIGTYQYGQVYLEMTNRMYDKIVPSIMQSLRQENSGSSDRSVDMIVHMNNKDGSYSGFTYAIESLKTKYDGELRKLDWHRDKILIGFGAIAAVCAMLAIRIP